MCRTKINIARPQGLSLQQLLVIHVSYIGISHSTAERNVTGHNYNVCQKWDSCNLEYKYNIYTYILNVSLLQLNLACDMLMTLAIKRVYIICHLMHLSYVFTRFISPN